MRIVCPLLIFFSLCVATYSQKGHKFSDYSSSFDDKFLSRPRGKGYEFPGFPIAESGKTSSCPPGFNFYSKQCIKTTVAEMLQSCPPGRKLIDGQCALYVAKLSECPPGSTVSKGQCVRLRVAEPEVLCPEGFTLHNKDTCVRKVQLPGLTYCPPGTVERNDRCIDHRPQPFEHTCRHGYVLRGSQCFKEEMYDCTPRAPPRKSAPVGKREAINFSQQRANSHLAQNPGSFYHEQHVTASKKAIPLTKMVTPPPVVNEYVIKKTCKRVITEHPHSVCPKGAQQNGKECFVETVVPYMFKDGGTRNELVPVVQRCPPGFVNSAEKGGMQCTATQQFPPIFICPEHTTNVGNRCANYVPPVLSCPVGFDKLNVEECQKTLVVPPVTKYSVTYSCTGKHCVD